MSNTLRFSWVVIAALAACASYRGSMSHRKDGREQGMRFSGSGGQSRVYIFAKSENEADRSCRFEWTVTRKGEPDPIASGRGSGGTSLSHRIEDAKVRVGDVVKLTTRFFGADGKETGRLESSSSIRDR